MKNLISDTCNNCGKDVQVEGYYPDAGCICSDECLRALREPIRLRQAGIDEGLYAEMRLDNYVFEDDSLKERLYKYLEHPNWRGWGFFGDVGTGKTHLAVGITREMIERYSLKAKVISVPEFIASLRDNVMVAGKNQSLMHKYKNIEFLVLDDLGAEKSSEYVVQQMFLLMNHRLVHKKPTIITSNFSLRLISERIDERIASRILQMCRIIILPGGDYRLNKQQEGA